MGLGKERIIKRSLICEGIKKRPLELAGI
jgi:hypothetical protein